MNLTRILTLVRRTFLVTFRGSDPLIDFFYWPLYDIMIWGFTSAWIVKETQNHQLALTILASLVLWQAVYRTNLDISFNFLAELWSRNIVNLFVTPLTAGEWMAASMITGALNAWVALGFGSLAVWALYGISIISIGWIFPLLAVMLFFSGWSLGLFTSSLLVTWGGSVQKFVWVMGWFFVPFVGIFYPVESMPWWAQSVAYSLPMTYFFNVLQHYIVEGVFLKKIFVIGTCLSAFYFITATLFFLFLFQASRKRGLARLETFQ